MPVAQNQDQWSTVVRDRVWVAYLSGTGNNVIVRHHAVLSAGEELTEYPETWELTWDEWVATHETTYGLTLRGTPVAEQTTRTAAWRTLRRTANGTDPVDQAFARAVYRILRTIAEEIAEGA